jgi:malate dehydrogenase
MIKKDKLDAIIERTKVGGGELVNLMGTSAWYAPGAAAAQMAISIIKDEKRIYPCCVRLNGQYKLRDIFVGAPVKLGKKGIQEVIKLRLKKDEMELLHKSAGAVKEVADALDAMKLV